MWVFTEDGFYSAVANVNNPELLLVRCRAKVDADRLAYFANRLDDPALVIETPSADYRWRLHIKRETFGLYLGYTVLDLGYPNFKEAIGKRDPKRAAVYGDVWATLLELQPPHWDGRERRVKDDPLVPQWEERRGRHR